jgi:hypothetical protein
VPGCSGGFGLWNDGESYVKSHKAPEEVTTEFKMKSGGLLDPIGKACLTDPILLKVAREQDLDVSDFKSIRDEMVGDGFIATLGPKAKYGNRRLTNARRTLDVIRTLKFTSRGVTFSPAVRLLAQEADEKMREVIRSPETLGSTHWMTPGEVIANGVSRSQLLTEKLYMKVKGLESKRALYSEIARMAQDVNEQEIVMGMTTKKEEFWMLLYSDSVRVIFNEEDWPINVEIAALIRRLTLHVVGKCSLKLSAEGFRKKNLPPACELELITCYIAKYVWRMTRDALEKVCF